MGKKTQLDEIIDDLNGEIVETAKVLDQKRTFRDQLVAKRQEKKGVKRDNNSNTETD